MRNSLILFLFIVITLVNSFQAKASFNIKAGAESSAGCGSQVRLHVEPAWEKLNQNLTTDHLSNVFFSEQRYRLCKWL